MSYSNNMYSKFVELLAVIFCRAIVLFILLRSNLYTLIKKIIKCVYIVIFFLLKIGYLNQNSPLTTEPILLKELYACIIHFSPPPPKKSKVLHRALTIRLKIVKIMFKVSVSNVITLVS